MGQGRPGWVAQGVLRTILGLGLGLACLGACSADPRTPLHSGHPESSPSPAARVASVFAAAPPPVKAPVPTAELLAAPAPPQAEEPPAPPSCTLVAQSREVFVLERPASESRRIGYLRLGARVLCQPEPIAGSGCPGKYRAITPAGFVCVGPNASIDGVSPAADLAQTRPDRFSSMPYHYVRAVAPAPPLYTKLPSPSEARETEPEWSQAAWARSSAFADVPSAPVPDLLAQGGTLPTPFGHGYRAGTISTGRALSNGSFAVLDVFEIERRRYALTTDLLLLPLDRARPVEPSRFQGSHLEGTEQRVAFVMRRSALLYTGEPPALRPVRALEYRESVALTGKSVRVGKGLFVETDTGDYLEDQGLVGIPLALPSPPPRWARSGRRWIHVRIQTQTLVMYEGERPVFATLVSTGIDGLGDPETTHATVQGEFLIHTKHVSATMDSDEVGDEYDLRDVPYVQYFNEGYAFHAAYWHDAFGHPRSHGCINLSPADARVLFQLTDPPVPPLWHGAMSLHGGTLVQITP